MKFEPDRAIANALGYELYFPADQATMVYELLIETEEPIGRGNAGFDVLGSLRLEKGYRDYGPDIDITDGGCQSGLSFAVDTEKPGELTGL